MVPIELRYSLTPHDLVDGLGVQRHGVRRRWRIALLALPALVGLAIGLVRSNVWDRPADSAAAVVIACLVLVVLAVGFGLLTHRVFARRMRLWQARLIMRGNPAFSQPVRTTVSGVGISAENATGASRSSWSQYPLYVETDRSFVLLASKGFGAMALVLPKRAVVDGDATRLRAMLDAHSHRAMP
ncbi:YcxB family protein [Asanoa sp. NPDC049573]|uniref:YcxB family protein n=1 Tax=Asanoa sp. NPDC049573 TaxID=3155396 RepID=UPI003426E640